MAGGIRVIFITPCPETGWLQAQRLVRRDLVRRQAGQAGWEVVRDRLPDRVVVRGVQRAAGA